jgi:hypothetical protein
MKNVGLIWFNRLTIAFGISEFWSFWLGSMTRSSVPASQARPTPTSRRTQKEVPGHDAGTEKPWEKPWEKPC